MKTIYVENAADIAGPNGKTAREENNARKHLFEVGELVECKETEDLFIIEKQTRDCDGTPLYSMRYARRSDFCGINEDDLRSVKL